MAWSPRRPRTLDADVLDGAGRAGRRRRSGCGVGLPSSTAARSTVTRLTRVRPAGGQLGTLSAQRRQYGAHRAVRAGGRAGDRLGRDALQERREPLQRQEDARRAGRAGRPPQPWSGPLTDPDRGSGLKTTTRSSPSRRAPVTLQRCSTEGRATMRRTPPTATASSSPTRARSSGAVRGPGQAQDQLELRVARGARCRRCAARSAVAGPGAGSGRVGIAVEVPSDLQQRRDAGGLGRGVIHGAARGRTPPSPARSASTACCSACRSRSQRAAGPRSDGGGPGTNRLTTIPSTESPCSASAVTVRRVSAATTRSGVSTSRIDVRAWSASIPRSPASCSARSSSASMVASQPSASPLRAGQPRQHAADRAAVRREQPLDVARDGLRQAEQPQRLGGGAAVDDHDLPRPALGQPRAPRRAPGGPRRRAARSARRPPVRRRPRPPAGSAGGPAAGSRSRRAASGCRCGRRTDRPPPRRGRRRARPPARRRASAPGRSRRRAPCGPTAPAATPSPRPGSSCRRHPCP